MGEWGRVEEAGEGWGRVGKAGGGWERLGKAGRGINMIVHWYDPAPCIMKDTY